MSNWKDPIHPGEILAGDLEEIGISGLELAKRLGIPNNRIYQILAGRRGVTADTALRLGKFFVTGPDFWLNLQKAYELETARETIGPSWRRLLLIRP
jgi:addiction module HigA family antidote